jgi:Ca2+/H+ antiporter
MADNWLLTFVLCCIVVGFALGAMVYVIGLWSSMRLHRELNKMMKEFVEEGKKQAREEAYKEEKGRLRSA